MNLDEAINIDIPDPENVGPAMLGKEPIIGSARRDNDGVVLRDELRDELNL